MLHPDEALSIVISAAVRRGTERAALRDARGRALASALSCLVDQPPFDKSKMDGFAYRSPAAAEGGYRATGIIAAGDAGAVSLAAGECVRIMTGAPVPFEATGVQRFEFAEEKGGFVFFTRAEEESNIIRRGSQLRAGDPLVGPRILTAEDLSVLAACGHGEVEVVRRPRVAVLSTGSELRAPGDSLPPGTVHDSNGILLRGLVESAHCIPMDLGRVGDDSLSLTDAISRGLDEADVLLISGGVSKGDFDFVPAVCGELGVETLFRTVALKPGKPAFFGKRGDRYVFGCPGNPLSAYVVFGLFVRPLLFALLGVDPSPRTLRRTILGKVTRATDDRVEYFPVSFKGNACVPLRCDGSSMVTVLAEADGFGRLDIGRDELSGGEGVDVGLLR